jgi:hypothetical protein
MCASVQNAKYALRKMVDVHIWTASDAMSNSAGAAWGNIVRTIDGMHCAQNCHSAFA